jgi:hypothetical protein
MGADEWDDPHGLVPRAFKNTFPEHDSVRDALRQAERLPSSTPPEDRAGACPDCGSVAIGPIGTGQGNGSANDWKCNECEHRFTDPKDTDMTHYDNMAHLRFNFVDDDELADPDERGMSPLFAGFDDETLAELAIRLYKPWSDGGPCYRELVELFPYGRKFIGNRVRAWKDGEYRDLVPDPTADPEPITVDDAPAASSDAVATDGGRRRWEAYGS